MDNRFTISLKAARVNAGYTQDDVAREMHVSKSTIVNWETGKIGIPHTALIALCSFYNTPLDFVRAHKDAT